MSNTTGPSIPIVADAWAGYLAQAGELPTSRILLLAFVNVPVLAIVLNVLWQVLIPRRKFEPPLVFHWLPIVGSAIEYGNNPLKFFLTCREKYGDVFTFILLGRRVTVALGPKGNNFVLGGKSTVFGAEEAYTHLTTPVFGKDVVYDVPNDVFMEQKKFVKFGLTTENFRAYVGMIEEEVENFLNTDPAFKVYQQNDINEWGQFDVLESLSDITILTASRTLQGREVRSNLDKSFSKLYNDLDGGFTPLNFMFPNLPLESYRKRDLAQKKMSDFYVSAIQKRKEGNADHEPDMIESLMSQTYRSGKPLRDHEIAHIMIALLMAGQHTSSATSSWALLHMADNPQFVEALYQEQVKHFGTSDGKFRPLNYEEMRDLPILDSAIRETLRLHPPIHSIMRYVRDDVPVPPTYAAPSKDGSFVVPKGHYVLASPLVSQMDPKIWRDPAKWDPYRWNDPEGVASQALKTYVDGDGEKIDFGFGAVSKGTESPYQPFGAGRHRCIGEQFAYLQLGTILATIVRKLEIRIPTGVPEHNYHTMITLPKKPRQIHYRRRQFD
ncbi:lanosterol 14-alpha-demethylase [Dendrothele bispora CBS 962.96]|uniref:Lanosterol 14-alpha-demethylase n=1 Tax=Dendrothele bispora (strain CBS 962.96) TaxID=1314807 RepID=A0A4S8MW00_DENBC|nr:lanosterol 14-alpha-demethylase [Dendrothele bispora CBS 962.96]